MSSEKKNLIGLEIDKKEQNDNNANSGTKHDKLENNGEKIEENKEEHGLDLPSGPYPSSSFIKSPRIARKIYSVAKGKLKQQKKNSKKNETLLVIPKLVFQFDSSEEQESVASSDTPQDNKNKKEKKLNKDSSSQHHSRLNIISKLHKRSKSADSKNEKNKLKDKLIGTTQSTGSIAIIKSDDTHDKKNDHTDKESFLKNFDMLGNTNLQDKSKKNQNRLHSDDIEEDLEKSINYQEHQHENSNQENKNEDDEFDKVFEDNRIGDLSINENIEIFEDLANNEIEKSQKEIQIDYNSGSIDYIQIEDLNNSTNVLNISSATSNDLRRSVTLTANAVEQATTYFEQDYSLLNNTCVTSENLYKILIIGDLGTGKTSIVKRCVHQTFATNYRATIGVDFALKLINWDSNTLVRLQLWDISGQERLGNMTRVYYKEAVGALIVFDITRSSTFDAVFKWKLDLDSKVQLPDGSPIPCVLLANKCDQLKDGIFSLPSNLEETCQQNGINGWFQTSAKENINIDESIRYLVKQILSIDINDANEVKDSEMFTLDKQETGTVSKSYCSC